MVCQAGGVSLCNRSREHALMRRKCFFVLWSSYTAEKVQYFFLNTEANSAQQRTNLKNEIPRAHDRRRGKVAGALSRWKRLHYENYPQSTTASSKNQKRATPAPKTLRWVEAATPG